jgi:transcriptional regulator with GAF, ATPase, and Fis domain
MLAMYAAVALKGGEWMREIDRQRAEIDVLQRRLESETALIHSEIRYATSFPYIVGTSPLLHDALRLVEKIAPTEATVLITGETGTGKELVARAVHELSARRSRPLVSVNCPAIPLELAESELFGHERGAFTGAVDARAGKLELADGGTIFLDEVADLPMAVQVKLLRVLQEREVQRVGSHKTRYLDLRIIAATNRDLREAVQAAQFREDLYYRLAGMPIHLPPLRDRTGDIRMLASHFLDLAAARYEKSVRGFTADALEAMERYQWPGNVRELAHVIERAVLLCGSDRVQLSELPGLEPPQKDASLRATLRVEKRRRVEVALFQCEGNQAAAARLLGMSRSNFARLVKALGVRYPVPRMV